MKKTSNYNMQMRILSTESPRLISKIANSFKEDDITCANVITYLVNFSHFNHAFQNRYLCTTHELKSGQPLPHSQWKLHSRFFLPVMMLVSCSGIFQDVFSSVNSVARLSVISSGNCWGLARWGPSKRRGRGVTMHDNDDKEDAEGRRISHL